MLHLSSAKPIINVDLKEPARLKDVHLPEWVRASSKLPNFALDGKVENKITGVPELDEGAGSRFAALIERHGNENPSPSAGRPSLVRQALENQRGFTEIANSLHYGRVTGEASSASMAFLGIQQAFNIAADGAFQNSASPLSGTRSNKSLSLRENLTAIHSKMRSTRTAVVIESQRPVSGCCF